MINENLIIPDDVRLYTVTEAAKILKTNKSYIYQLINSGNLPCVKIGHIKIRHDALSNFLSHAEGWDFTDPYHVVACTGAQ